MIVEAGEECDGGACCNSTCHFRPSSFVCRASASQCDGTEFCTGALSTCPADIAVPTGTACDDGDACTISDVCTGLTCAGSIGCAAPGGALCSGHGTCCAAVCTCTFPFVKTSARTDCFDAPVAVIPRPVDPNAPVDLSGSVRAGEVAFFSILPQANVRTERITVTVTPNNGEVTAYGASESVTATPSAADASVSSAASGFRAVQTLDVSVVGERYLIGVFSDTQTSFEIAALFTFGVTGQIRAPAAAPSSPSSNGGVIAAAILVPLVVIALCAVAAFFVWKSRSEGGSKDPYALDDDAYVTTTPATDAAPLETLPPSGAALAPLPASPPADDPSVVYVGDLPEFDHYARSEFDREPEADDELRLTEGALLCVVDSFEDGWGSAFYPVPPFAPGAFPLNHAMDVVASVGEPFTPAGDGEVALAADDSALIVLRDHTDGWSRVCHRADDGTTIDDGLVPSDRIAFDGRPRLGQRPAPPPPPAAARPPLPPHLRNPNRRSRAISDFDLSNRQAPTSGVAPPWVKRSSGVFVPRKRTGSFAAAQPPTAPAPDAPVPLSAAQRRLANRSKRQSRVISDFDLSARTLPPLPATPPASSGPGPTPPPPPATAPKPKPDAVALDSTSSSSSSSSSDSS